MNPFGGSSGPGGSGTSLKGSAAGAARALLFGILLASASCCPTGCQCTEKSGTTTVRCTSGNLEAIPSDLPRDTVALLLASNHITKIPNYAFRRLGRLQELDLSDNDIETVEAAAFHGLADSLQALDLANNRIRSVPKEAFAHLRAKINLSDNPWHCECVLQEVLRELRLDPQSAKDVVCRTAVQEEYAGRSLIQVLDSGINFCNFHRKTTDVAMFVTMFGWFGMVIAYVVYYVRHNREDARRHLEYLKSLPGGARVAKDLDTVSTVL
ncbi:leucine-rich repeat-containing protein 3 [Hippocampus zosterae]|uniref:leucine-rich repeat-containing protein 3 n=1 Tax=Hippocampus zosterae TaxID=109293 RepID=UPI00223D2F11|nr:leucine-rich repeat-containing protein 3 [Hippocampus zosterae]